MWLLSEPINCTFAVHILSRGNKRYDIFYRMMVHACNIKATATCHDFISCHVGWVLITFDEAN